MGTLFAVREGDLVRLAPALAPVLDSGDVAAWHQLWPGLAMALNLPRVLRDADLPSEPSAEPWQPTPRSKEHLRLLRSLTRSLAACRIELQESKWHVNFPQLSEDQAGFPVGESEEYEALGRHLFTTSTMPAGLEFLDEKPDVSTNWVSTKAVKQLWVLERGEGLLQTAGSHMRESGLPLGVDFLHIRTLLEIGSQSGWALYLWDPGS